MEELKRVYNENNEKFLAKYEKEIYQIATNNNVPLDIAGDMLKAVARGNEDYGKGIAIDIEELKQDCLLLRDLSKKVRDAEKAYIDTVANVEE